MSYICQHCGKEYKSESWFNKHIEKEHGDIEEVIDVEEELPFTLIEDEVEYIPYPEMYDDEPEVDIELYHYEPTEMKPKKINLGLSRLKPHIFKKNRR